MKFYELLRQYSNIEILNVLHMNYDDIKDDAYVLALDELRQLQPSDIPQNIKINVEFAKDDGKEYLQCDGIGPDKNGEIIRWGLEYQSWNDWLAQELNQKCFNELDELTILSSIMWELTYNGFSQSELNERKMNLENRCN